MRQRLGHIQVLADTASCSSHLTATSSVSSASLLRCWYMQVHEGTARHAGHQSRHSPFAPKKVSQQSSREQAWQLSAGGHEDVLHVGGGDDQAPLRPTRGGIVRVQLQAEEVHQMRRHGAGRGAA